MPDAPDLLPLPLLCRTVLRVASWIVPGARRAEWLREWHAEIWHWWHLLKKADQSADTMREMMQHARGAVTDAVLLRVSPEAVLQCFRQILLQPAFCILIVGAVIAAIVAGSNGLAHTRGLIFGVPFPAPERLVTFSESTVFVGQRRGIPLRKI